MSPDAPEYPHTTLETLVSSNDRSLGTGDPAPVPKTEDRDDRSDRRENRVRRLFPSSFAILGSLFLSVSGGGRFAGLCRGLAPLGGSGIPRPVSLPSDPYASSTQTLG